MRVVTKRLGLESRGFRYKVALYLRYRHIKFDDEIACTEWVWLYEWDKYRQSLQQVLCCAYWLYNLSNLITCTRGWSWSWTKVKDQTIGRRGLTEDGRVKGHRKIGTTQPTSVSATKKMIYPNGIRPRRLQRLWHLRRSPAYITANENVQWNQNKCCNDLAGSCRAIAARTYFILLHVKPHLLLWCRTMKRIKSIQNYYMDIDIFRNVMPLTSSKQDRDIMIEALSLISCLLFNANTTVQVTRFYTPLLNSLQSFALQVILFIIGSRRIVQVICICAVIIFSCLIIIQICIKNRLLFDLCMNILNRILYWYLVLLLILCFYCCYVLSSFVAVLLL